MNDSSRSENYPLRRRVVVSQLLEGRENLLVIAGLGASAWDTAAAGDHPLTFPLWGAMGGSVSLGLGLALAQPESRVLVITGDGEMLMGLGSLATAADKKPENLAVVVLDNERYGETGMQATHTAGRADLASIATASGFPVNLNVHTPSELESAIPVIRHTPGPVFCNIKVRAESLPLVLPPKDGEHLKERFRLQLLKNC